MGLGLALGTKILTLFFTVVFPHHNHHYHHLIYGRSGEKVPDLETYSTNKGKKYTHVYLNSSMDLMYYPASMIVSCF